MKNLLLEHLYEIKYLDTGYTMLYPSKETLEFAVTPEDKVFGKFVIHIAD